MNQSAPGKFAATYKTEVPEPQVSDLPEHSADVSLGHDLLRATRPFANENVRKSWWYVSSTFALIIVTLTGAALADGWPTRTVLALLGGLLMVRAFITYHDFMHGAILRDSWLASFLFHVYGALALTPARSLEAEPQLSSRSRGADFVHQHRCVSNNHCAYVAGSVARAALALPRESAPADSSVWIRDYLRV